MDENIYIYTYMYISEISLQDLISLIIYIYTHVMHVKVTYECDALIDLMLAREISRATY